MAENDADTVIILSSELIAQVIEVYFNEEMFKLPVKIVDLKASGEGYAFSLAFTEKEGISSVVMSNFGKRINSRNNKGQFVKIDKGEG